MSGGMLSLAQAAALVHIEEPELRHAAQRGELDSQTRAEDSLYFDRRALTEWAQRELLGAGAKTLKERNRRMREEEHHADGAESSLAALFAPETIELAVRAKAKAGMLRDMTELADRGGKVYDPEGLYKALVEREEAGSTAVGQGIALLHPKFHDPYLFEECFVAYGRSERPIFFGASDGEATRHFFLICSTDHARHLHLLARLAVLAHGTALTDKLDAAESAEDVIAAIAQCEEEL